VGEIYHGLRGRHLLWLVDYSNEDLRAILETTRVLKGRYYSGERVIPLLNGRVLGLVFQKPSTRTRVSFEVAMKQLGGDSLYLGWNDLQLGRGETIADTARVLSRYLDGIAARVYKQEDLVELAERCASPHAAAATGRSDETGLWAAAGENQWSARKQPLRTRPIGCRLPYEASGNEAR